MLSRLSKLRKDGSGGYEEMDGDDSGQNTNDTALSAMAASEPRLSASTASLPEGISSFYQY